MLSDDAENWVHLGRELFKPEIDTGHHMIRLRLLMHIWELNTDVELVAGDVNGTNFKRSLNLKLLFAWSAYSSPCSSRRDSSSDGSKE